MQEILTSAPGVILAALAVAVALRGLRDLVVGQRREGILGRILRILTDPVVRPVRAMAPWAVPRGLLYLFAVCWLVAARMLWFIVSAALGVRTGLGA